MGLSGCGGGDTATTSGQGQGAAVSSDGLTPLQVIDKFLAAIKAGDDLAAEKFLTEKALQETRKHELVVSPPGSDTARYEVLEAEEVEGGKAAHVLCRWSDGEGAEEFTQEMIWVLQPTNQGWRVCGLISQPFPDMPPVTLNFENPEEMLRQQSQVEEEMNRRERLARQNDAPGGDTQPR
jgi:hypothetical protein